LRNDKKLVVSAAQKAQKAADFILQRSAVQAESTDESIAA
jgi:antirestriction protein ArdC